jgi:hypothetical protein
MTMLVKLNCFVTYEYIMNTSWEISTLNNAWDFVYSKPKPKIYHYQFYKSTWRLEGLQLIKMEVFFNFFSSKDQSFISWEAKHDSTNQTQ